MVYVLHTASPDVILGTSAVFQNPWVSKQNKCGVLKLDIFINMAQCFTKDSDGYDDQFAIIVKHLNSLLVNWEWTTQNIIKIEKYFLNSLTIKENAFLFNFCALKSVNTKTRTSFQTSFWRQILICNNVYIPIFIAGILFNQDMTINQMLNEGRMSKEMKFLYMIK